MSSRSPLPAPAVRRSFRSTIPAILFWALVLMTLLHFNGILYILFFQGELSGQISGQGPGQGRFAWVLISLCAASLCLAVRRRIGMSLGLPGFLLLAVMVSHLGIGTAVYLSSHFDLEPLVLLPFFRYSVYSAVVVATAAATTVMAQRTGVVHLLERVLVVMALGCLSVLATPWLASADMLRHFSTRMYGFYMQANQAGAFASMTVWLAFVVILCKGSGKLAAVALTVAVPALLATASRGAYIYLLAFLAIFVAYWLVLRPKIAAVGFVVLLLGALIVVPIWLTTTQWPGLLLIWAFFPLDKLQSFLALLSGDIFVITDDLRWIILSLAVEQIQESPIFGSGFQPNHAILNANLCNQGICSPHNFFIMLWQEAGIVPPLLYLGYFWSLLGASLGLPQRAAVVTVVGWTVGRFMYDMLSDNSIDTLWMGTLTGLCLGLLAHEIGRYRARPRPRFAP